MKKVTIVLMLVMISVFSSAVAMAQGGQWRMCINPGNSGGSNSPNPTNCWCDKEPNNCICNIPSIYTLEKIPSKRTLSMKIAKPSVNGNTIELTLADKVPMELKSKD